MDVKDLRTEPALSERNNDGSKYTQGGGATLQCNRNKSYQDIGSNPLAKAEGMPVRPCAVIGPDRVVPPPTASDAFLRKGSVEPWPSPDNGYRRPPDYPHRLHQNPARNISPRQTFQENMQRINVPPTYNAVRHSDSANFNHVQDRSVAISKNAKPNMVPEAKYCDVPYALNALPNEPKNVRDSEMYVSSVNSQLTRSAPHVWPPGSVNVNSSRTYSANEPYQYSQYASCAGQRPPVIPMARTHRTIQEDPAYVYPDHYYRDAIGRIKPYPPMKERCPQPRYEYVGNYAGQFHPPPPIQPLKYDIPKSGQTHPYPVFPHFKYLDNRVPDPNLEGYQRSSSHQPHYNLPFHTQVIHPTYAQVPGGGAPQKVQPYPPDGSIKTLPSNKLHYDNSNKMYIDYENARTKPYPMADNYYVNEMNRFHPLKNQMVMPNYSPIGMRAVPSQQYYIKDNTPMKPFEYMPTFRNFEPHLTGNPVLRHAPQFSPNTLAISPTDSNTSNDTSQTHGTSQEDCGYVSQSSTTSVRSIDSGFYRLPHEYYKRHDFRYGPIVGSPHTLAKTDLNSKDSKQKQINVRQFLQMWNEGEEENNSETNNSKEIVIQTGSSDMGNFSKHANTQDQLYVLGLVNVSSEDLSKYEHIEKISKLPENIKGYNNLELFSRFEEAMESCNSAFKPTPKEYQNTSKDNSTKVVGEALPRPVSPLDVESKISQSVIHKEVGCNFEIKPCSPKMLNVEVAAPARNILGERTIEKVTNPLSKIVKSPLPIKSDENSNCHTVIRQDSVFAITDNPSCKMVRSPFSSNNMDSIKANYTLQDLEINSGVCLASLPRLDNEIELNFPEVNQQFINANKKDVFPSANSCRQSNLQDSPSLLDNKDEKSDSEKSKIIPPECDKSINKLSKYRKSKTSTADISENKSKAIRTDSVIIKNPENIENKMLENSLNIPMNLSSQSTQWYDSPHESKENKDNDMALDFSLNKSSNDLPLIEIEKDTLIKPLQINQSHLSRENVLPTDANASCQESAYINDITVNSKTIVDSIKQNHQDLSRVNDLSTDPALFEKSTYINDDDIVNQKLGIAASVQTDPKTYSKIQNTQEIENKTDVNNSYKVIKSTVVKKDTDTSFTDSTLSNSLVFEATKLENKNYETDQHAHTDSGDSQASIKKQNIDGNTVISDSNIDDKDNLETDFENHENLIIRTESVRNKDIENMKQFFKPEEYNELNKSELLTTSQNENDFEHDEISASLEKLFRDSNEDISPPKNDNGSLSLSVTKPSKENGCHQSKELYSPWIQKLLTHSEGLCKEIPQKTKIKSIFDPDEYIDKPDESELLEQHMKIDYETTASTLHIKSNKFIIQNVTKDLTLDIRPKIKSNALNRTSENIEDSMNKLNVLLDKIDEPHDATRTLIKEHNMVDVNKLYIEKVSHQNINDKKLNSEGVVDKSKRKIKKRKLHASKLHKQLKNCDKEYTTNVNLSSKIDTNNCKNNIAKNESETIVSRKNSCDSESVIQKDSTAVSFKNVSDFLSDKEEQTSESNGSRIVLTENILPNHHSDTASEILNSSNTDFHFDAIIQDDLNESSVENVSSDASHSFAFSDHQKCDNLSIGKVIENIFEDRNKVTGEMTLTSDNCTVNLKNLNYISSDSSSKDVSGIFTQHQEQTPFTNMTINNIDDNMETSDNNDVVKNDSSNIRNSVLNDSTGPGIKESKSIEYLAIVTKHCAKVADNNTSSLLNITPKVLKDVDVVVDSKSISDSIFINNCISHQTQDNKSEKRLIEKRNSSDDSKKEIDSPKYTETICNYDVVSQENQNKESLVENTSKTPDSAIHQMSKTVDSLEVAYIVQSVIPEDPKIDPNHLTASLSETSVVENTFEDLKRCKNHEVVSETLDNANIDDIQEDQHNFISEILSNRSSENSYENIIQENQNKENVNASKGLTEAESNSLVINSDFASIKVGNTDQDSQHLNTLPTIPNYYINPETQTKIFHDCLVTNNEIEIKETLEVDGSSQNVKIDFEVNENCSYSKVEHHQLNDNSIKLEIKDEIEKGNKSVLKNSDLHTTILSDECGRNNSEPDSLIQENNNDNPLTNLSDQRIEDCNNQPKLSNTLIITTKDDEYLCCEDKEDNLCDPVIENNHDELDNHVSNIHDQEASIQESPIKRRLTLKRSFSDSALNNFKNRDTPDRQLINSTPMWPPKRQKMYQIDSSEQQAIDEKFCNFIQNRRNSVSSYYNAENVSFCILIDNDCILTEENEGEKICFAEVSEDCITELNTADAEDSASEVICGPEETELGFSDSVMLGYSSEKSIQESWLDDVACVETVVSDDIVEDGVNDALGFSEDVEVSNYDESGIFNSDMSELTRGINFINEETVHDNVSEFENTYETPCNDNKIMLCDGETQFTNSYNVLYDGQCMEKILSESYRSTCSTSPTSDYSDSILLPDDTAGPKLTEDKENVFVKNMTLQNFENELDHNSANGENNFSENIVEAETTRGLQNDNSMHLPESSVDNVFSYHKQDDDVSTTSTSSSSPEVSSTTYEEKSSSILLKITNYNGSRVSEINEVNRNMPRCKFTESKDYSNLQGSFSKRPLITKGAQKYIPPLKESIRDLKVKLPLPQQRLLKLKQLKLSRSEPKVVKQNILAIPKKQKPKPNFEDVLKNIDEVQIKMHKQNSKKIKNIIPKVVIKKNVNGSHYTSSSSKDKFNPDLTGRKWQPWVFLERNSFIDNMAMRNKTKAIFSHRKNTYVLAEKFKKYKSVSNCSAKFVISQPKTGNLSKGQLKYTIRLKPS